MTRFLLFSKEKKITVEVWRTIFEGPEEKEPLCSLVTQQLILLDPSANGSRVNRLRQQWVFFLSQVSLRRVSFFRGLLQISRGGKTCNERDRFLCEVCSREGGASAPRLHCRSSDQGRSRARSVFSFLFSFF